MVHFITYSNDLYSETREYALRWRKGKVDTITVYKPEDIMVLHRTPDANQPYQFIIKILDFRLDN